LKKSLGDRRMMAKVRMQPTVHALLPLFRIGTEKTMEENTNNPTPETPP